MVIVYLSLKDLPGTAAAFALAGGPAGGDLGWSREVSM